MRDATKMEKELQTLKDSDKLGSGSYEVHKLNLKSLRSVEAFGRKIRHSGVKVNILINNGLCIRCTYKRRKKPFT